MHIFLSSLVVHFDGVGGGVIIWVGVIIFTEILWWGGNFPGEQFSSGQLAGVQFTLGAIIVGAIIQRTVIRGVILLGGNCPRTLRNLSKCLKVYQIYRFVLVFREDLGTILCQMLSIYQEVQYFIKALRVGFQAQFWIWFINISKVSQKYELPEGQHGDRRNKILFYDSIYYLYESLVHWDGSFFISSLSSNQSVDQSIYLNSSI